MWMPGKLPEESGLAAPLLQSDALRNGGRLEASTLEKSTVTPHFWRTLTEYCRDLGPRRSDGQLGRVVQPGVDKTLSSTLDSSSRRVLKQQASDPTDYLCNAGMVKEPILATPHEFRRRLLSECREDDSPSPGGSGLLDFVLDVSFDVQEHYWRMAQSGKAGFPDRLVWDSPGLDRTPQSLPRSPRAVERCSGPAKRTLQSSDLATVLVILKSFLGGTLLVAPAEFLGAGLVSGNLLFTAMGLLELWCMLKLLQAYRKAGGCSFGHLANLALGPAGSVAVEVSIVASQLGFIATEMIYVARNGAPAVSWLFGQFSILPGLDMEQESIAALLTWLQLLLVVPIAWNRELAALTTFNFVGNLLVLSTTLWLAVAAITGLTSQGLAQDLELLCTPRRALVFMGFSVFTFEGINMVIPMYESHRDKASFDRLLVGTIIAVIVIFSSFASGNVLLYGYELKPILTLNIPQDSLAVTWVPVAFAVASLALVPLLALPTFEVLEGCLARQTGRVSNLVSSHVRVNGFRAGLLAFCALMARYGGKHLDDFLSVVGAVACVPLALIYPAAIHLRLVAKTTAQAAGDWLCIVLGMGVTVLCTVEIFCPLT
eukprot:TRINITY_DN26749_c0_g1_i1.p1 TRINITY_DN26749_c0_g1~~TRINITY_DN26749_c0_g1_i1.p1  ORF type:complete len:600 (-),score=99.92 TRINITY_DN26749_c0_g1_i1:123-1922(-)